jgi:hypothetical protein
MANLMLSLLGALGLIVNALVLWNTRYMDAALGHLRSQGAYDPLASATGENRRDPKGWFGTRPRFEFFSTYMLTSATYCFFVTSAMSI